MSEHSAPFAHPLKGLTVLAIKVVPELRLVRIRRLDLRAFQDHPGGDRLAIRQFQKITTFGASLGPMQWRAVMNSMRWSLLVLLTSDPVQKSVPLTW